MSVNNSVPMWQKLEENLKKAYWLGFDDGREGNYNSPSLVNPYKETSANWSLWNKSYENGFEQGSH